MQVPWSEFCTVHGPKHGRWKTACWYLTDQTIYRFKNHKLKVVEVRKAGDWHAKCSTGHRVKGHEPIPKA